MLSPLYGQLSPLRVPTRVAPAGDADALAYIAAVEAADGQALEEGVATAFSDFIVGCKSDGIWGAIKASCILAGARTLDGALVPLVGSAPTNYNFVSADYNRETGLKGNGSTKYLDSSRANNADPQNSKHLSIFQTDTGAAFSVPMGSFISSPANRTNIIFDSSRNLTRINSSIISATDVGNGNVSGLKGGTRYSSSQWDSYRTGNLVTQNSTSSNPGSASTFVFALNNNGSTSSFYSGRLSFYSIGEDIDLAALDTRVSTLMTDLAAAIP